MNLKGQIELKRQESEHYGNMSEHYRLEAERVQVFAIAFIASLVVIMMLLP